MRIALAGLMAAGLVGCTNDLRTPQGVSISCSNSSECPESLVCVASLGRCMAADAPCVERQGSGFTASPDDAACVLGNGSEGFCSAATCVASVCGDGKVTGKESCDEMSGSTAFVNPNDACHKCRPVTWAPTVLVGGYGSGQSPDQVPTGEPWGMAFDGDGNLFVADTVRHRIWRIDAQGTSVTVAAGVGTSGFSGDGGHASQAELNMPTDVAVDRLGNLYIADYLNDRIRKVDRFGTITTLAGDGAYCDVATDPGCGNGGPANEAHLWEPTGIAVSLSGHVYFTESDHRRSNVRAVSPDGNIRRVAGAAYREAPPLPTNDPLYGCDDGVALDSRLREPKGLAVDALGAVYVADSGNHRIVKLVDGQLSTVAGLGPETNNQGACTAHWGDTGDGGAATLAKLNLPSGVAVDALGNLHIADTYNHRVRKVDAAGVISTSATDVAGVRLGDVTFGSNDFQHYSAGIAVDRDGAVYVSSTVLRRIHKVVGGTVTVFAGNGSAAIIEDRASALGTQIVPQGLALDGDGRLLVSDSLTERILRLEADGTLTTFAGSGERLFSGDGEAAVNAGMMPRTLAGDGNGTVYVSDYLNNRIRKIDDSGQITTVAGNGSSCNEITDATCGDGGPGGLANIGPARALAFADGELYLGSDHRVRRIAQDGIITRVCGTTTRSDAGDGDAASLASILDLTALGFNASGHLCASVGAQRIRCINADGDINTIVGTGRWGGYPVDTDMAATGADLRNPHEMLAPVAAATWEDDSASMIYASQRWHSVRSVDASGDLHIIAGGPGNQSLNEPGFTGDGGPAVDATLSFPTRLIHDTSGNLYVAEQHSVRMIAPSGTISTAVGPVYPGDGPFGPSYLVNPTALAFWPQTDSFIVADGQHGRLRSINLTSQWVETVAGYPGGFGNSSAQTKATNMPPLGDAAGIVIEQHNTQTTLFVTDRRAHVIRAFAIDDPADASTWTVTTLAGSDAVAGHQNGALSTSLLSSPAGLALDAEQRILYVADMGNHVIRSIALADSTIGTAYGTAHVAAYYGDGVPATEALFNGPEVLMHDAHGNLFVADAGNHRVRRIGSEGDIETVLGSGFPSSLGDGGPAHVYPVRSPRGLAADEHGNLFVSSSDSVRLVVASNGEYATGQDQVMTIYGTAPRDSYPSNATECLTGLHVNDATRSVYVIDACQGYLVRLDRVNDL